LVRRRKQARKPCDGVRFAFSGTGNDRPRFLFAGSGGGAGRKIADKDVEGDHNAKEDESCGWLIGYRKDSVGKGACEDEVKDRMCVVGVFVCLLWKTIGTVYSIE
jgi:hypothetical protein